MGFDVKSRLSRLRSSAKKRKININLDINKYQYLINLGCHYCGDDLKNELGYCLDRMDSNKGYTYLNVVGCCKICNRAKSNMTFGDFISWIQKAHKFQSEIIEFFKNQKLNGTLKPYKWEEEEKILNELHKEKEKARIKEVYTNETK